MRTYAVWNPRLGKYDVRDFGLLTISQVRILKTELLVRCYGGPLS
jgi:hypothetical protein